MTAVPQLISPDFNAFLKLIQLPIEPLRAEAIIKLFQDGNTVPFIARYRKEKTRNADEDQIRKVIHAYESWQELISRQKFIWNELEKRELLTVELSELISSANTLVELEEIYRPFKKQRKTKAKLAREAGLEPLADWLWQVLRGEVQSGNDFELKAKDFINPQAGFATYQEALRGAQHIMVERITHDRELRHRLRKIYLEQAFLRSEKGKEFKPHSKFSTYAEFEEKVSSLLQAKNSHRYLALKRGWGESELKLSFRVDLNSERVQWLRATCSATEGRVFQFAEELWSQAIEVHVQPSIENEIHKDLVEVADTHAIRIFAGNVKKVLLSSPLGAKTVLGVDPGLRTGCKLALVDKNGEYISHTVIKLHDEGAKDKTKLLLGEVIKQVPIAMVAVGNGTGGREAEQFFREVINELEVADKPPVVMVSEAGASVYSASEIAREEFPDLDLTVRGAISIARRLQDPLAELVKIDPKSIGVGQYQHDINTTLLKRSLDETVESCVNSVGIDLNTASRSLLTYVSGIGPQLAENIVGYRKTKGLFKEKRDLLKVEKFGEKSFEQSAGFFRIQNSPNPLDRTGIHPERYSGVREMAQELGVTISQLQGDGAKQLLSLSEKWSQLLGEFTFHDIIQELEKPGRDSRSEYELFQYREDIHAIADLKIDMICPGLVTNVTSFGAFVDIGVHQDGLVHISQMATEFVQDPQMVVSPGDRVKVRVISIDIDKKQIGLSMKLHADERTDHGHLNRNPNRQNKPPRAPAAEDTNGKRNRTDNNQRRASGQDSRSEDRGRKSAEPRKHRNQDKPPMRDNRSKERPSMAASNRGSKSPFNNPFADLLNLKK